MQHELSNYSDEELLRLAIHEAQSDERTADLELGQIYGALVAGNTDRERIWQEETAPLQVELDLHLEGASVKDHATRVDKLALFVSGINDASKAIVREKLGLKTLHRNLLIAGLQPGSVRVTLRADEPPVHTAQNAMDNTEQFASSPDSEALRTIARLITNASEAEPAIASDVEGLPAAARKALGKSVRAFRSAGWDIGGTIRQRGHGIDDIRLTQSGASVLSEALRNYSYVDTAAWVEGRIDGFRRSLGSLYFIPTATGRPVSVVVEDSKTLGKATRLAANEGALVSAFIRTVQADAGREDDRTMTSRTLLDIAPADSGAQLEMPAGDDQIKS